MKFIVKSVREDTVTIDGLGVFSSGETEVSEQQVKSFKEVRGLWPIEVHLPEGVEFVVIRGEEAPTEEEEAK